MNPNAAPRPVVRLPIIRHFIACEGIERSEDGRRCSLLNLLHAIRPSNEEGYPYTLQEISLFVLMTDASGVLSFQVRLTLLAQDETQVYASPSVVRNMGANPLAVFGWPIRLRSIMLPQPGIYEFRLLCENQVIAREPLLLREVL